MMSLQTLLQVELLIVLRVICRCETISKTLIERNRVFLKLHCIRLGEVMRIVLLVWGLFLSPMIFADAKTINKIDYVYVLDTEKSFDFAGGGNHACGSNIYRTHAETEAIANRKFSVALAAYTAGQRVTINTEGCSGNRMKFGWIRIHE